MNEDKKVLITGASGGLGRACAVEAAKAGYYVICHYNGSKSKAEETLRLVEESGGKGPHRRQGADHVGAPRRHLHGRRLHLPGAGQAAGGLPHHRAHQRPADRQ